MELPSLEEIVEQLKAIADADEIDPDQPVVTLDVVDSLDLMEWVYSANEEYGLQIDESLFDELDETVTLRQVYDKIMANVTPAATGA